MTIDDGFVPFRPELAESYRARGYWRGETLSDLLRTAARTWADKSAVLGPAPLTYAGLDAAADRMASGLLARGIVPGDRVVVQLPNAPEFAVTFFGLIRAGVIPVLCLPAHGFAEIGHLATLSGAVGYIGPKRGEIVDTLRDRVPHIILLADAGEFTSLGEVPTDVGALPDLDPAAVAVLLISGGTTGLPKLIPRTHDDYAYNARASAEVCRLTGDDVYLVTLPAAHNFPLACPGILGTVSTGGSLVFLADPSPESAFAAIEQYGVTVTAVVPPLAQLWCAATEWEEADLASLRLLQVGGARLPEQPAREVTPTLGAQLQQVFGMAEGLLNYTRLDDDPELIVTTQGRPLSAADEVRVVDGVGNSVPVGTEGELLTRGPYTIRGYYRAPEHNQRAFTLDGYYRTGDLVTQLPTGHLVVTGRIKDVINRGGENVSCDELEEHLIAHPAVRQAAAVGIADEMLGEKVCAALVVTGAMPSLAEIKTFLAERGLAPFKTPDSLVEVASLPLTPVGKIDKRTLVTQIAG